MAPVESACIPAAGHYLLVYNPESVADLIERHPGTPYAHLMLPVK
jgi:hypothetical protein